ncbi:hypothetical protein MKU92_004078 [Salmonella enterica]|nr:hypothetical protein [Salmonella enterica]
MTDNDTINSKQIAAWLVDARHVTRTADESSDEYAAARAISTLGLALLGTSGELSDLRARNQEVESLLAIQQRTIDTQREEINSLKSGEPVGYLVGTALLENLTQATAYRDDTGLEIRPLFTASPAWHPAETSPDVPRGESLDCWVAVHFAERDYAAGPGQYRLAQPQVLRLSWLNAGLTDEERECWDADGCLPDGAPGGLEFWQSEDGEHGDFTGWTGAEGNGYRELVAAADGWVPDGYLVGRFKILAWQPIIKPDFPLGAQ